MLDHCTSMGLGLSTSRWMDIFDLLNNLKQGEGPWKFTWKWTLHTRWAWTILDQWESRILQRGRGKFYYVILVLFLVLTLF